MPFDFDRVGTEKADAVQDRANPGEIDGSTVAKRREIPVFEAAAVVLDMDVAHELFDLVELVARIGTFVVVGDVAGIEVEPT